MEGNGQNMQPDQGKQDDPEGVGAEAAAPRTPPNHPGAPEMSLIGSTA